MAETEEQKKLRLDLEEVRSQMEDMLDDESVTSLPKAFKKLKDDFDTVLSALENGEYYPDEDSAP